MRSETCSFASPISRIPLGSLAEKRVQTLGEGGNTQRYPCPVCPCAPQWWRALGMASFHSPRISPQFLQGAFHKVESTGPDKGRLDTWRWLDAGSAQWVWLQSFRLSHQEATAWLSKASLDPTCSMRVPRNSICSVLWTDCD